MKNLNYLLAVLFVGSLIQTQVSAQVVCDEACLHQKSLATVEAKIIDFSVNTTTPAACPQPGHALFVSSKVISSTILGAESSLNQIGDQLKVEAKPLNSDSTKCGQICQQVNLVTPVTVSRPFEVKSVPACDNYPTSTIQKDLPNEDAAKAYAKETLNGKNPEGQALSQTCPDPCSFYVYTGNTDLENSNVRLNLVVRCGQPKKGVFSKYQFSGANVHEWVCQKN